MLQPLLYPIEVEYGCVNLRRGWTKSMKLESGKVIYIIEREDGVVEDYNAQFVKFI
jgi:hypothetical protein